MKISQKAELIFPPPEQALLESHFPRLLWQKTSFPGMPVLCICMCGPEASSSLGWMGPWDRKTDNTSHFTRRLPNCSPLCTPVLQAPPPPPPEGEWERKMSCSGESSFHTRWKGKKKWTPSRSATGYVVLISLGVTQLYKWKWNLWNGNHQMNTFCS